jgi:hypothetical protein
MRVFNYRCPDCGKQHAASAPFEGDFQARCLRCGRSFPVTRDLVQVPAGARGGAEAITTHPAARAAPAEDEGREEVLEEVEDAPEPAIRRGGPRLKRERRREEDEDEGEEGPARPGPARPAPRRQEEEDTAPAGGAWWKRWPGVVGLVACVLLIGGVAGYLTLGRGKTPTPKKVAKRPKAAPKTKAPVKPAPVVKKPSKPSKPSEDEPAVRAKNKTPVLVSAPRLAAELAADRAAANARYRDTLLEVTGLLAGLEVRLPPRALVGLFANFVVEGAPVACYLHGTAEAPRWRALKPKEPFTVRGVYGRDGLLHQCELAPLSPPADARYKGKTVEVSGVVDRVLLPGLTSAGFPTIQLEEGTYAKVEVECLFRKAHADEVKGVPPGAKVTIRGTCNGRYHSGTGYRVRLDNCRVVDTSAPEEGVPRLEARRLAREYEEDLLPFLLPAGPPVGGEKPIPVAELGRELKADPGAFATKYRHRVLTVKGRLLRKEKGPRAVMLEGTETDQDLQVRCLFGKQAFEDLEEGPDLSVRGLCTALEGGTLRLDDCEALGPRRKDPRRLTAEYLPHEPGRSLTYDAALFPLVGRKAPQVFRQVWMEREGGVTEMVTTHQGTLAPGKSLLDPAEKGAWVSQPRTKKVRLPAPGFQRRASRAFVEIAHRVMRGRKVEVVWEPVLKVGARVGESWRWVQGDSEHTYTLAELGQYRGRPSAVIREVVVTNLDDQHPREVRRLYVAGVGEVERHETLRVSTKEKRTVAERRLVSFTGSRKLEGTTGPPR